MTESSTRSTCSRRRRAFPWHSGRRGRSLRRLRRLARAPPPSVSSYTYGTTNNQLVDISPTGNICAGTWNRNSGGGIADYTICNFPNPLPNTGGLPYAVGIYYGFGKFGDFKPGGGVCACPGEFHIAACGAAAMSVAGYSWRSLMPRPATAANGTSSTDCARRPRSRARTMPARLAPGVTSVPNCTPGNRHPGVYARDRYRCDHQCASLTRSRRKMPGTTVITASIAGSGSSAGYFSTCPPQSDLAHPERRHQWQQSPRACSRTWSPR